MPSRQVCMPGNASIPPVAARLRDVFRLVPNCIDRGSSMLIEHSTR